MHRPFVVLIAWPLQLTSLEMGDLLKKVDNVKGELDEYQTAVLREASRYQSFSMLLADAHD